MATTTIGAPGSIPTPPAGQVEFFLDSTNGNVLSYKDENGIVHVYDAENADDIGDECCCDIIKDTMSKIACAVEKGVIKYSDFKATTITGTCGTVTANNGDKTTTISVVVS